MADLHSIKTYTADGTSNDFSVPFPFQERSHVTVYLNGTSTAFTWINDGKINVTGTVVSGDEIKLVRSTSVIERTVIFSSPTSITTFNLNDSALQLFYMAQEALDGQEQSSAAAISASAAAASATAAAASAAAVASDVNIWAGTASGVDTILLTPADALASYSTGMKVRFESAGAGTGAATINISSLGAKALKRQGGTALVADDIPASSIIEATYDGTDFILDTGTTAVIKATVINEVSGSNIASATTTDIGAATGNYVNITGTTTITGLGTIAAGAKRIVQFSGALTLTYNATSLIVPGNANITTVAGDIAEFVSLGSGNWICTNYLRENGSSLHAGKVVQLVNTTDHAVNSGSTVLPWDDSIPQNTEGDEYMTLAITPNNTSNILKIDVIWNGTSSSGIQLSAALFQDVTAGALSAGTTNINPGANEVQIVISHYMTAGTTSATTFKVRVGGASAATTTFNGTAAARTFGGVHGSSITITEYLP